MKKLLLALVGLTLFTLGAWAHTPPPVPIDPKADVCPACGMSVGDSGYAAEILVETKVSKFDSVVEAAQWLKDHPSDAEKDNFAFYVQHALTKAWLPAQGAFYVYTQEVATPMRIGIHAFTTQAEADAFSKGKADAKVVAFADLITFGKKPGQKMKM